MLTILGWIIFGLIAGVIAKAIMPGRDPGGAIVTILLGIAGSVIGGLIGRALFGYGTGDSGTGPGMIMSMLLAVVGAIVLLAGYRLIRGRSMHAS
ncbi:MAG: hypothetical protein QOJ70_20 [Acidobacteriota bacterium]|jgi:uncharacterized membrane protein YeaQ/YmgE (transglycosylase-associated protein family)|nr:hypothetical protein [Acidobacteriota bacterium]MDT7806207.1 hypothetical protein [Acidobacteriota bacterium]